MSVVEVGHFKGIVTCKEPSLEAQMKTEIEQKLMQIQNLLKPIYECETKVEFDFNIADLLSLADDPEEDGKKLGKMIGKFEKILVKAGLAQLKIGDNIQSYFYDQQLQSKLNESTKCQIRLYIIEGFNFAQKDLFSLSDPYLVVKCGSTYFNEQKNY